MIGAELHQFARELFPICRSITGNGIRQTLALIGKRVPLEITEVPTGTPVFDWTVPKEWNIRDAFIMSSVKERVVDFRKSNLHVLNYSTPIRATLPLRDLKPPPDLFTAEEALDGFDRKDWRKLLRKAGRIKLPELRARAGK